MNKPTKQDYERLSELLRIADKCWLDKKIEPDYGEEVARIAFESYHSLRWWPNVRMVLDSIQMRSNRGVWWSAVYTYWSKHLIDAARKDKALFIIGGKKVLPPPEVTKVDTTAMKLQYEEIIRQQKLKKMRQDA